MNKIIFLLCIVLIILEVVTLANQYKKQISDFQEYLDNKVEYLQSQII